MISQNQFHHTMSIANITGATADEKSLSADHRLLSPGSLGVMQLPNRILMAPMTRTRAASDGSPSALMTEFYALRATAGLVISDSTFLTANGRTNANEPGSSTG